MAMTITLEKVARAIDPWAWEDRHVGTAAAIEAMHRRRQASIKAARAAIQALIDDAKFESYPSHPKAWLVAILDEQKETAPQ